MCTNKKMYSPLAHVLHACSLNELVSDNVNGRTFTTAHQLSEIMIVRFTAVVLLQLTCRTLQDTVSSKGDNQALKRLARGIQSASYGSDGRSWTHWEAEWEEVVLKGVLGQ